MPTNAVAPAFEGQPGIVCVWSLVRIEAGHRPVQARGQDVDLAHVARISIANVDRRGIRREPGCAPSPVGRGAGRAGPLAEPENHARAGGRLRTGRRELESPGEHGVDDDPARGELEAHELAAPADRSEPLADES